MSWECDIEKENYSANNAIALELTHPEDGPIAVATVCLPDVNVVLETNQTWIKTWSENEGILEALIEAGIVKHGNLHVDVNGFGSMAVLVTVLI